MRISRLPALPVALGLALLAFPLAAAPQAGVQEEVDRLLARAEGASPEGLAPITRELAALGEPAGNPLVSHLPGLTPRARLVAAEALFRLRRVAEAAPAAAEVVADPRAETPVRVMAAELLGVHCKADDLPPLKTLVRALEEPLVRVAAAKVLRKVGRDREGVQALKELLTLDREEVRAEAALALAELGNAEAAKAELGRLAEEPTARGRLAREYLLREQLMGMLDETGGLSGDAYVQKLKEDLARLTEEVESLRSRAASAVAPGGAVGGPADFQLLSEVLEDVRRYYIDEKLTDHDALVNAAVKGLVGSLDPFSSYWDERETAAFKESISGSYAGIGAVVSIHPRDRLLTIIRPIYSGPAYRAGLRSLDRITEVEGVSTYGKTIEELVSTLKGTHGSEVHIKVFRKGWRAEREYTIVRETIELASVHRAMLPAGIGYLSLSQFGETAVAEVEEALQALEAEGMRALVLDLRSNPGGLLEAAVEIADKFLDRGRLIVYSEGRNPEVAPRKEFWTRGESTHPPVPMVVLVNGASASASEIVSGALQDHARAVLVGEQTFGKGSVQQLLGLTATRGASTLRLTVAKYYLPSGRSIHEVGVAPDIVVAPPPEDPRVLEPLERLRASGALQAYVEAHFEAQRGLFLELAAFDWGEAARYPGFEELHASLETTLDRDVVRRELREAVRARVQDELGHEFASDLQEDLQLQRGVLVLLGRLGLAPDADPRAAWFAPRHAGPAEPPAAAPDSPGGRRAY
ncbi:MAG: S41 family peptidase [Planctomycetes bacterium]|nr:S41 family peptidase [Planctomycetota bacterium]